MSRRLLQIVVAVLGLLPIGTGLAAFALGPALMPGGQPVSPSIDNEYRFLAVFWFAFGVVIYWMLPNIERQTSLVRFLCGVIFLGGVGRLISYMTFGAPHGAYSAAMVLELIGMPLLVLWQATIAVDTRRIQ